MARKRMFDYEIIDQDDFYDLSSDAIAFYFLLGMNADDEGFVNPKKIMKLYNVSLDSLKVLILKNYIIPFKSGVVVITDWKRNNWLDKRRLKETIYQEEKAQLIFNEMTEKYECLSVAKQMLRENRIEENRIEEGSIDNIYTANNRDEEVEDPYKDFQPKGIDLENLVMEEDPLKDFRVKE